MDLGCLAQENTAAKLTGTADITLKQAKFQRGRIEEITGRIVCGPGTLGRGMLAALVTDLRLVPSPQMPVTGQSLAFDSLGLDFWIDYRGVTIAGHCANLPGADMPGTVAVGGGRALLTQPTTQPQPVAALIQALVPVHEGSLARLLPAPDSARANQRRR